MLSPLLWTTPNLGCTLTHGVHPKMGVSFWLPLESYTGMLSPLLWTTPNLGCTLTHGCGSKWG